MSKIFFLTLLTSIGLAACSSTPKEEPSISPTPTAAVKGAVMVKELVKEDIKVGEGEEASAGAKVTVHYTGTLTNGIKFDSSVDRGVPFEFNLGAGEVIQGWDEGVAGMKVGGSRKLTIPPEMAYGNRDMGTIKPNSVLIFEVELLKVSPSEQ